jgi:hypothetical protein
MTLWNTRFGELLQHISEGVVLVVAAALTRVLAVQVGLRNTCCAIMADFQSPELRKRTGYPPCSFCAPREPAAPGAPNYAAAKAGITTLTVVTARSCGRYGVRANAICPRARTDMTADLMGAAPDEAVDPLAPEHVAPLVVYLSSPAAAGITGEVFVVHGGVAAVMEPPRIRTVFLANEHGSEDGMWSLDSVASALAPMAASGTAQPGFASEDTLALAAETIGFDGGGR